MNEDMILPEGFEATPQAEEVTAQPEIQNESVETEATPQATEETVETPQQQLLRVKYNKEEREIPIDEAIPLVQKGLNYDKVQERLQAIESDPRLTFVESMANQFGMTVEEYMSAVQQQQEQERINELVQQGISEELAQEMLENRKFRQQFENERKAKQEEEKKNVEYQDFFQYFRQSQQRDFNPDKDEIPQAVWEAANNGVPLKYAYMSHEVNQLKTQLQTLKQNELNAQKAPISGTTAHGSNEVASEDPFLMGFNSI
jgi:hypothetical protein